MDKERIIATEPLSKTSHIMQTLDIQVANTVKHWERKERGKEKI